MDYFHKKQFFLLKIVFVPGSYNFDKPATSWLKWATDDNKNKNDWLDTVIHVKYISDTKVLCNSL